jgi:pimeloyl-ACP methyl ester carboxylesterase
MEPYALSEITAPVLIIHAMDDPIVPYEHALFAEKNIPGARLVLLQSGGHLLIGQHEHIRQELVEFIEQLLN